MSRVECTLETEGVIRAVTVCIIKIQSEHCRNAVITTLYVKYQSNTERHRAYISTHRVDVSFSSKYAAMEDIFITIGKGNGKDDVTYKMNPAEKDLLDTFMLARNNSLLWGKCNVDKHGKAKIYDEDGQPKHLFTRAIMGGLC